MNKAAARRVQRAFAAAAHSYDGAAEIQRRVVDELIRRLPADTAAETADQALDAATATAPATVLDLGCGTGYAFAQLAARYPQAHLLGLDFAESMLRRAPVLPRLKKICANATALPIADASVDLLFSSLTYQWCALDKALTEAHRVLRPGARLAFSTLTGNTFRELHDAFAGLDDARHALPLLSPDLIARTAVEAGFSGVEVFETRLVARFSDVRALFDSIRRTGASEIAAQDAAATPLRRRGLLGKRAWAIIEARLLALADGEGRLPLTYDVIYVLARRPGAAA